MSLISILTYDFLSIHFIYCEILKRSLFDLVGIATRSKVGFRLPLSVSFLSLGTLSSANMWEEPRWKSILHVQMRGIYSQGWNWPLWLFNFPHECLTYMNIQLYMWLSWTSMLHYIDYNSMSHSSDVAEMTHDMT